MIAIINHGSYFKGLIKGNINIYQNIESIKDALNISKRNDIEIGKTFYIPKNENYYTILPAIIKE